jgi:hypothetical protein
MTNILNIVLMLGMGCVITGLVLLALAKIWSEE